MLETTIEGASHVIINISGDISLIEANEAASYVQELAGDDANIIFGAMYDENAQDEATITVIATGLTDKTLAATPVSNAMKDFKNQNPYKKLAPKTPSAAEAAATAAAPHTYQRPTGAPVQPGYTKPSFNTAHSTAQPRQEGGQAPVQPQQPKTAQTGYNRQINREGIVIPSFLQDRNKKN